MEIQTHNARNTDPETSHLAAEALKKAGKSERKRRIGVLLKIVEKQPGLTSAEIAQAICHSGKEPALDRYEVARRLSDAKGPLLKHGESRLCTATNKRCVTWYPVGGAV